MIHEYSTLPFSFSSCSSAPCFVFSCSLPQSYTPYCIHTVRTTSPTNTSHSYLHASLRRTHRAPTLPHGGRSRKHTACQHQLLNSCTTPTGPFLIRPSRMLACPPILRPPPPTQGSCPPPPLPTAAAPAGGRGRPPTGRGPRTPSTPTGGTGPPRTDSEPAPRLLPGPAISADSDAGEASAS
jgi:hypothetical protein